MKKVIASIANMTAANDLNIFELYEDKLGFIILCLELLAHSIRGSNVT